MSPVCAESTPFINASCNLSLSMIQPYTPPDTVTSLPSARVNVRRAW